MAEYSCTYGGDWGGGYANTICVDLTTPGRLHAGGDVWGQRQTINYGDDWYPTNGTGTHANNPYGRTCAFSQHPETLGDVYIGCGTLARNADGGFFGRVVAGSRVFEKLSTTWGFGTDITLGGTGAGAAVPRPSGQMIVTDYSSSTGLEYIYLASSHGLARATQNGDGNVGNYTSLGVGVNANYGFKALELFGGSLYAASWGGTISGNNQVSNVYRVDTPRSSSSTSPQVTNLSSAAPTDVHDIVKCGTRLLAACVDATRGNGIYEVTGQGSTWTKISGGFFSGITVCTITGDGQTLYASLQNAPSASQNIARSLDGGASWSWVAQPGTGAVNFNAWGSTTRWWLYQQPGLTEGTNWDCSLIRVDPFDVNRVWASGRRGVWHSRDGGDTWRPAVRGMNGGETGGVKWQGGTTWVASDVDWKGKQSTDDWGTAVKLSTAPAVQTGLTRTVASGPYAGTYTVHAPDSTHSTYWMTLDGARIDNAYFRGAIWDPSAIDVNAQTGTVAIGQSPGGGVWLLSPNVPPAAPVVTVNAVSNLSASTVQLNGTVDANGDAANEHFELGTAQGVYTASYGFGTITGTSPSLVNSGVITGLAASTTYYYRLVASNSLGAATPAAGSFTTQSGSVTLATPVISSATPVSTSQINVAWGTVSGAASYVVLRDNVEIAYPLTASYSDTGLAADTSYTYQVQAVNGTNRSLVSAPVSATTLRASTTATQFQDEPGTQFVLAADVTNDKSVFIGDATVTASGGGNVFTELLPGEGVTVDITNPNQLWWASQPGDTATARNTAA